MTADEIVADLRGFVTQEIESIYRRDCRFHLFVASVIIGVAALSFIVAGDATDFVIALAWPWFTWLLWPRRIDAP